MTSLPSGMAIMARERANRDYTVGYRKPPQGTRFKKGQSGNPKGRRKGVPNLSTLIITIMEEPVIVNEGGKRKAISKAEAMMKQLANRALTGDHRAAQLLINMMQLSENRPDTAGAAAPAEADRETMQHVIARMRRMARQGSDGNTDAD
jgi:Family of unknown function (DUF5681)